MPHAQMARPNAKAGLNSNIGLRDESLSARVSRLSTRESLSKYRTAKALKQSTHAKDAPTVPHVIRTVAILGKFTAGTPLDLNQGISRLVCGALASLRIHGLISRCFQFCKSDALKTCFSAPICTTTLMISGSTSWVACSRIPLTHMRFMNQVQAPGTLMAGSQISRPSSPLYSSSRPTETRSLSHGLTPLISTCTSCANERINICESKFKNVERHANSNAAGKTSKNWENLRFLDGLGF